MKINWRHLENSIRREKKKIRRDKRGTQNATDLLEELAEKRKNKKKKEDVE